MYLSKVADFDHTAVSRYDSDEFIEFCSGLAIVAVPSSSGLCDWIAGLD